MGFVWLIRIHLNRAVNFPSCGKASVHRELERQGAVGVSCVCSALAQVQFQVTRTCCPPSQLGSEPGTAWLRRAQLGNGLGLSCAQDELVWLGTRL